MIGSLGTDLFTAHTTYTNWIIVAALLLFSLSCLFGTSEPATEEQAKPDFQGTVAAALRQAEARQPSTLVATPTLLPTYTRAPQVTSAYTPDPSPYAPPEPTFAAVLQPTATSFLPVQTVPTPTAIATAKPADTPTPLPTPTPFGADERTEAPLFVSKLLDGSAYDLADTKGSPTLLVFWAPW